MVNDGIISSWIAHLGVEDKIRLLRAGFVYSEPRSATAQGSWKNQSIPRAAAFPVPLPPSTRSRSSLALDLFNKPKLSP